MDLIISLGCKAFLGFSSLFAVLIVIFVVVHQIVSVVNIKSHFSDSKFNVLELDFLVPRKKFINWSYTEKIETDYDTLKQNNCEG